MSLLSSETAATERATFPAAGPFSPVRDETKGGQRNVARPVDQPAGAYPVLAAVAAALVSMRLMGA
jgi:hypothetical protein